MTWHEQADAAQLTLTWADNSDNEDGFRIERKIGTGGTFGEIATVGANVITYVDPGLGAATTYCYRLLAYNTAGASPYSNEACGTTPQEFALTVVKAGTASGTVTSAPAGITCGTDCSEPYASGTAVTLTATPATGAVFGGWSGGG
ncbi:MAG: fibronectin type III domain-containing protein, partial [Candidatus Rokubacteria bacterium]|nr:fibronectin type III domain-containing protein [Candidatus Rokubacteria bacterium]